MLTIYASADGATKVVHAQYLDANAVDQHSDYKSGRVFNY